MAFTPLNALNAFLAVARRRSFAAAASELRISPSALSQSVRQLEARLGVPLLSRTTRSVALTEAGRLLFEQAGPAVNQALEAMKAAAARTGEVTGKVRLTVPEIAVPLVITPVLPRFHARYPRVEVDIQVENRRADIVAEGFDAGIRLEEFLERDMVHVRLTEAFRFVVVGAPSYLERRGTPEKPKDLLAHDCICYRSPTTGALYPWEFERGKKSWRVPVSGSIAANTETIMVAMAEAGLGLTYAFEPSVLPQLKHGSLRLVLEPYAALVPGFFLYFPSRAQVSPAFRAFMDTAREVTANPKKNT
ncbi:LysR family transcriptional regulator [Vitiosangium sp. GDMCC 1.1324]|uniref:LysR family transcriptional regulator n=1 Tax=Vitiosangium sp. (strain GDMCC 1.1324) TaxID=2138576 RepID=UPI000D3BEDE8|nr:LysR family transcriptional regulator [Vitiosangium sp. GDMCC 1.1324]PTL82397.1 LysR family transcriptional regulator [Vitiosangium sp. GDMCC 1.1324]